MSCLQCERYHNCICELEQNLQNIKRELQIKNDKNDESNRIIELENSLSSLKKYCDELEDQLENINDKETSKQQEIKDPYHLDPIDFSQNRITKLIDKYYTEDMFMRGQKGLAYFIFCKIIRDKNKNLLYKCIDENKKIFVPHFFLIDL